MLTALPYPARRPPAPPGSPLPLPTRAKLSTGGGEKASAWRILCFWGGGSKWAGDLPGAALPTRPPPVCDLFPVPEAPHLEDCGYFSYFVHQTVPLAFPFSVSHKTHTFLLF